MKLRFSIRTALLATTLLCCLLYWRVRPAIVANQFKCAVDDKSFEAADALVNRPRGLGFAETSRNARRISVTTDFDEPTIRDWLLGRQSGQFEVYAEFVEECTRRYGTLTASATGVNVESQSVVRIDYPLEAPEETDISALWRTGLEHLTFIRKH